MTVIAAHVGDYDVTLRFRYDPQVVDTIKTVPAASRSWDATAKEWTIEKHYWTWLADALRRLGHTVSATGAEQPTQSQQNVVDWADAMFAATPERLVKPLYKAVLQVVHPDIGGDTTLAQAVTQAWHRRKKAS